MPEYETRIIIFSDIDKKQFSHQKKVVRPLIGDGTLPSYRETADIDQYEKQRITGFLNEGFELISSVVYPVKTGLFGQSYNEFKYIFAKKIRN